MDIEKEREAFEAVTSIYHCIYNADLNYYFSGSKFVGNKAEIEVNAGWKAWQAAKAQAVPEWINVNLLSPQVDTEVLVCVGDDVKTAIYRDLDGEGYFEGVFGAKWWMPKPKAQEPAND